MSAIEPEISVIYKLTRELSLDFDDVVVDVDISNIQMKQINNLTVDFNSAYPKIAALKNYAVNNVTLQNGLVLNGKLLDTVRFQLPLSVEGKSRSFYIRVDKPTACNYRFVECDGMTSVDVQSNVDLSYKFDDYIAHPSSLSTYIFECYELCQGETTKMYIGSQNQLSSIDAQTSPIRVSKI